MTLQAALAESVMTSIYPPEHYRYTVFWSADDAAYIGTVGEFPSLSAIADTLETALKEIKTVVEAVLTEMAENGEIPPAPLSFSAYGDERRRA